MKKRRLKVLLLADSSSFHAERFTAELHRQGCRVLVASLERGPLHHYHLKRRTHLRAVYYLISVSEIRRLITRFRPDIINPHYASGYGFSTALATIGKKVPVILNLWGSDILRVPRKSFLHKFKITLALKAADCVIGDSEYLLQAAEAVTPLSCKRVIPWGIEQRFLPLHKKNYAFQRPLKIIVPRRHEKVYNNQFIVLSLASLIREGKVEITFPNFGSLAPDFRKNANSLFADRVRFYEKIPRNVFLPFMAGYDVYLSASTSDSSPASLIEAMALGLVPIAADIPGVREWLHSNSGYLFQPTDPEDLKSLIHRLLQERNPHERMRRMNLARVKEQAVFEENIAEQINLMEQLAWEKQK